MTASFDLAIVGAGFSGSLLAAIARRVGLSVVLIEKSKHPRFAIGEYVPRQACALLNELAVRYELPRSRSFASWERWRTEEPDVAGGKNVGLSFVQHDMGPSTQRVTNRLFVPSPSSDGISSLHWYRAAVDEVFCDEAIAAGSEYLDQTRLSKLAQQGTEVCLTGTRLGTRVEVSAKFVLDATGARGFVHHAAGLFNRGLPEFPNTQGLYSHFQGIEPSADSPGILSISIDETLVHHIFDGGWMWILRFNNGLTSAGIAVTDEMAGRLRLANAPKAWQTMLDLMPDVRDQFAQAKLERPLSYNRRISYLASAFTGNGWAMLPTTAGFADPLMATGFTLTLNGIQRLALLLERDWGTDRFEPGIAEYAMQTENEVLAAGTAVTGLYKSMNNFPAFSELISRWRLG
jgi:FADH2 O2-dependent halogenase